MKDLNVYLLGEQSGTIIGLPSGESRAVMAFNTIKFGNNEEAVAAFLSPIDAEICRHYLNEQQCDGQRNDFEVIKHSDPRVKGISALRNWSFRLVCGFVLDQVTKKLVVQGVCPSSMHFSIHPEDQAWMFGTGMRPEFGVMSEVQRTFAVAGEGGYLGELRKLVGLDGKSLTRLANVAVRKVGVLLEGNPKIPAVFSPRRGGWVELNLGS